MDAWTSYFRELSHLLRDSNRQHGVANLDMSELFIERFELAIQSCRHIRGYFENLQPLDREEENTIDEHKEMLDQLVDHLSILLDQWKNYRSSFDSSRGSTHTPVMYTGLRGRPRYVCGVFHNSGP